eukprot:9910161-Alexandrium_andersonii.AAC.1
MSSLGRLSVLSRSSKDKGSERTKRRQGDDRQRTRIEDREKTERGQRSPGSVSGCVWLCLAVSGCGLNLWRTP